MSVPPSARGMPVVAFNLCRNDRDEAFDQNWIRIAAERHRRGIEHGASGNDFFRLADVRNDGFERKLDAAGHAGESHGRSHDFHEAAAGDGIDPLGRAFGKLAVQGFLESGIAGEFFEAAPVFGAVVGIVGGGGVEFGANGFEIQFAFLTGANVFALRSRLSGFDLVVHFHPIHPNGIVPSLRDLFEFLISDPRYSLSPLRGLLPTLAFAHGLRRGLRSFAASRLLLTTIGRQNH